MADDLERILADDRPVSKTRLRQYLSRRAGPVILAEGYGVAAQTRPLPAPPEAVQSANHAALMAALRAASDQGGGTVALPAGYIFVNDTLEIDPARLTDPFAEDALHKTMQITLAGAGRRATRLVQNHPRKSLVRVFASTAQGSTPRYELRLEAMTLAGRGADTEGNLVELYSWNHHVLSDLWLEGTSGCAIHISRAERTVLRDVIVVRCRQALMMHDAVNESYLFNFLPLDIGMTFDPLEPRERPRDWSAHSDGRGGFAKTGPVAQATRAGVHIEGSQNVRWIGGSSKALTALAGLKIRSCENAQVDHVYFEGFPTVSPAPNPSVIFGGAMEKTRLAAPAGPTDRVIRVEDARWFPRRYSLAAALETNPPRMNHLYAIYDPADPTDYEVIEVRGFALEDMHVDRRGASGSRLRLSDRPARAWPAGAAVTELSFGIGDLTLHGNHLEGFASLGRFPGLSLAENWERGETNGQVIVGYTFDEFCSARNFPSGDLPGGCHLELSGHNRVRANRREREATDRIQVHHRARVYVSQESQFGGLVVEQASDRYPGWMTVSRALGDHEPLRIAAPGPLFNLRRDELFEGGGEDGVGGWRPVFVAPRGAAVECRLYSVLPGRMAEQGRDFVAAFVIDTAASWPPELAVTYMRGRPGLTPHVRLRRYGRDRAVAVELGLLRDEAAGDRPLILRMDATSICGQIEAGAAAGPDAAERVYPLSPARFLAIAPVAAVEEPAPGGGEGGGELFVEDGALKYRSPAGTVTVVAPR
jgi:hypothetical protein